METIKLFCFCVWLGLEKIKEKNTTYYLLAMLVVVGARHSVRTFFFFRLFARFSKKSTIHLISLKMHLPVLIL